jgi:hypothetical protein
MKKSKGSIKARNLLVREIGYKNVVGSDLRDLTDVDIAAYLTAHTSKLTRKDAIRLQKRLFILQHHSGKEAAENRIPPRAAEFLLRLCCSHRRLTHVVGDLDELFERDCRTKGVRSARAFYWAAALQSALPLLFCKLRDASFIAALLQYGRAKIGW